MEITVAATIWGLFAALLLFPELGVPAGLCRAVAALLVAEFVALLMYFYGSGSVAAAGRDVVMVDLPLLAVALLMVAIMRGVSVHRRQ